jgi:FlaA1/EpsC-like NDP-sugar epimerase
VRRIRHYLLKNHIAPKWTVFIFDNLIGSFAVLFAIFLVDKTEFKAILSPETLTIVVVTVLTNTLFFYFFKTYEGIIRFSGFAEVIRVTGALISSFFCLVTVGIISSVLGGSIVIPPTILIINLAISSFLMVGYRLVVKGVYKNTMLADNVVNVILYGGGEYGSRLKQMLEQVSNHKYRVIAFVDDEINYVGKAIDNVRIFSFPQVRDVIGGWEVGLLIFAKEHLSAEVKNEIVDFCHEKNIEVRNLPAIDDWINGTGNLSQLEKINIEELLGRKPITIQNRKVEDLVSKKSVLVTGAAGSIGSEIARQIAMTNPSLLILCDQNESGLYDLEYHIKTEIPTCENIVVYIGDVRDEGSMEVLFDRFRPTLVYHAAAYKHVPMMEAHPSEAVRNNVLGTKVLADLSVEFGIERFLLISTDKAINPTNVMGATKRVSEIYVQALGNRENKVVHINHQFGKEGRKSSDEHTTRFITARFGNVLGSNGSVIPRFKEQISKGGPVTVTHPDIIRFFMTIPEACSLVLEASAMGKGGEVFLFDMGAPVKIIDLAKKMIRLAGYTPGKEIQIHFSGLRPGEKLYEELLNNQEEVVPTHHKKILITKVAEYDFYKVNKSIDTLIDFALQNSDYDVVKQMKRIIPEYISNNSVYQAIDRDKSEQELLQLRHTS